MAEAPAFSRKHVSIQVRGDVQSFDALTNFTLTQDDNACSLGRIWLTSHGLSANEQYFFYTKLANNTFSYGL